MSETTFINVSGVYLEVTYPMAQAIEMTLLTIEVMLEDNWPGKPPKERRRGAKNVLMAYLEQIDD